MVAHADIVDMSTARVALGGWPFSFCHDGQNTRVNILRQKCIRMLTNYLNSPSYKKFFRGGKKVVEV
jgi:hypothetical protein